MRRAGHTLVLAAALLALPALAPAANSIPTGTWFDGLEPGVCFDDAWTDDGSFDFSVPAAVVPCESEHANEVVARIPLGDGDFPGEDLVPRVDAACAIEHERFLGKPISETILSAFDVAPTEDDWRAGVRDALCMLYGPSPLVGTAASDSLRAPGETIAAYREVEGVPDLWLFDAGTGAPIRNLTANDLVELVTNPTWTPDGSVLLFSVQAGEDGEESDVHMLSLVDGSTEAVLHTPAREDGLVFSADMSKAAFIADADGADYDIYLQDLVADELTRLTDHPERDASPQFSPDGSRIVFRRVTDGVSDIWVMNADGSEQRQLTDNGADNYDPRWSPDGDRIAFTLDFGSNYDIGVMNADGSGQTLLTTHPADDEFPSWSSDGSVIAFQSTRHGGLTLWLMKADGTAASELTGLAPVGYPMFSPAGNR